MRSDCHVLEERNAVLWRVRSTTTKKDSKSCQIVKLVNSKAAYRQSLQDIFIPHTTPYTQFSSLLKILGPSCICSCLRSYIHFVCMCTQNFLFSSTVSHHPCKKKVEHRQYLPTYITLLLIGIYSPSKAD